MDNTAALLLVLAAVAVVVMLVQLASAKAAAAQARSEAQHLGLENNRLATEVEKRAHSRLQEWQKTELISMRQQHADLAGREARANLGEWKVGAERAIREDAVQRSQSVTVGKITEHIVPYLPEFRFNPKDARFIGSPIDFVVFDGLDAGDVKQIVIVEVKTGTGTLTKRERQVRDAIQSGRVSWEELRPKTPSLRAVSESAVFDLQGLQPDQIVVRVPAIEGLLEAIVSWDVPEGGKVLKEQPLLYLDADMWTIELPCPATGFVVKRLADEGATVRVGDPLAIIDTPPEVGT